MKNKNLLVSILLTLSLSLCLIGLTACGEKEIKFKLNFVVDNEIYATIDTSGDEVIQLPENPTKENHSFDGWFWDKDVWEKPFTANSLLDAPLSRDMSVYAKFSLNTINGVTFEDVETTYDGTEKTIAVDNLPNGASVVYDKANTYINAGEYTVTATISQENHEDLQLTAILTINKATYDMSSVVFADKSVTYNGDAHSIIATGMPSGVTVDYENNGLINAGEFSVIAKFTGDSNNYELIPNKTATLTINKASVSKPIEDSTSFVYNGNEQIYQIIENNLYTISGNKQTNAGNYNVIASLKDKANYQWSDNNSTDLSYSFNIAKATYNMSSVVFDDKTVTYNGDAHSIIATGMPSGVTATYENNDKINAGKYTVVAKFIGDSNNYELIPNKTATLTILDSAFEGLSFESKTFTYDGTEKKIEVVGAPSDATINYDKANKYTNAGEYTVTATIKKANYTEAMLTATLKINKATYDMSGVVFADKTVTYNGDSHLIEAQNVPNGLDVDYVGNGKINADTYSITARFTDTTGNYVNPADMTAMLTINKATLIGITFEDKTFTYDTKSHSIQICGDIPASVNVTYTNNDKVNADTYTVTASFEDTSGNYIVPEVMSAKLIIKKATITGITFENKTFTYNGTKRSLKISGTLPSEVTVNYVNNGKINADTYTVIATFTCETDNYNIPEDMTATLTIKKAVYDMDAVTFNNKTVTYDGKTQSLAVSDNLPNGVTVSYTDNNQVDVGQYIVVATFTGDSINYYPIDDMQAILTINKATYDMSKVQFIGGRFTYDGTTKSIYITGELPQGVTVEYTNNGKINAETYIVTATFIGDAKNYNELSDWSASLIIDKATYDMSGVSFKNQTFTYDKTEKSALISGNLPKGVEVSYVGNEKTDVGTYIVTAKFNGDSSNYNLIKDMTATLKINQAVPYINEVSCDSTLNVYSKVELIADTDVKGVILFDDGQTLTLGYKTYSWTFVPEDTHNYTNATGTIGLTVCALVSYYNDGVLFGSQNIVLNNSAYIPTGTPLREDGNGYTYTFSHWSIEENGVEYNFTNAITNNLNLYAVYDKEEIVYAVNYYDTKDVQHDNITTYSVLTEFTLLDIEKEHYIFNGWVDEDGKSITQIVKGTFGTLNIYATWTLVEYAITYDLGYRGAANGNNPITYNVKEKFSFVNATYDEYHTFAGWYLDKDYKVAKNSISVGEFGNITLYAKWDFSGVYVYTASDFNNIASNMYGIYELKNDINIVDTLGYIGNPFVGYFNGGGYLITGNTPFYEISGIVVNLKTNCCISNINNGQISYCYGGGIVAVNNGIISHSYAESGVLYEEKMSGTGGKWRYVGGVAAYNTGLLQECFYSGELSPLIKFNYLEDYELLRDYSGGLVGYSTGSVVNCYAFIQVSRGMTKTYISTGYGNNKSTISRPNASMYIGGLVGYNGGSISTSYVKGSLKCDVDAWGCEDWRGARADLYIGGIAGYGGSILYCFSDVTILASCRAEKYGGSDGETGGLAGRIAGGNNGVCCYTTSNFYITINKEYKLINNGGVLTSINNLMSVNFVKSNLYWDEGIWYLQDGQLPKLRFELEI